jgi:hypothetical protein
VVGGYVYRGTNPALRWVNSYGDYCSGRVWGLQQNGGNWMDGLVDDTTFSISTFGEDEAGEIYLADYAGGNLYRLGMP